MDQPNAPSSQEPVTLFARFIRFAKPKSLAELRELGLITDH